MASSAARSIGDRVYLAALSFDVYPGITGTYGLFCVSYFKKFRVVKPGFISHFDFGFQVKRTGAKTQTKNQTRVSICEVRHYE